MPKRREVRAALDKALSHLDEGERKLVTEAMNDALLIFNLSEKMLNTPVTDEGMRRIIALRDEIAAIDTKWTHD
jgi:hypothetical protein